MKCASQEIRVGLVQIGENFSGQYYLPYSVGLLHAYAQRHLTNYNDYHFLPPLYKGMPMEEIVLYFKDVNIIFFSVYMWNFNFSLEIAKKIKLNNPDCCIVFGGPQIPDTPKALERLLRRYPFIDIGCYGEGEIPFVQILENFQEKAWFKVSSIGYIKPDNSFARNDSADRISDLNQIPSPYLGGIFEPLMKANPEESWAAMWESNRGCPFSCSYCAWGKDSKRTIYKYDMERLFGELDWFSNNKIEFIFCCDANFGLFKKRDMEIVDKAVENKKKFGYPKAFSVQSTKNATRTIFELQKRLNSVGLQKGVNLALQSVNKQTLRSINRSNISSEKFQDLQKMFTDAGIATFTDMILGLPDESYHTFIDGVSNVIKGGQHNRIQFINLSILENTEMATPEYIEKFGLISRECKMVSHHTSISTDNDIPETQVLVIGTQAMPMQDWVKTRVFCWMISLLHFNKLLQILFVILNKTCSLSYKQLIEWFLICDKEYPIISKIVSLFNEKALSIQSGETEFIPSREWLNIYWPADEFIFIKLCGENNLLKFYEEAKRVIFQNLQKSNISMPESLLNNAVNLNLELIKQPFITENKKIELNYNILECYQGALLGEDIPLKEGSFHYEIIRSQDKWNSWFDWCKEVVWFGTKKGDYLYSFLKK
ncbi:MAG: radical SAM protein [Desulfobacterales bacterium]|nr:radical SAM protein [Desulfobacterales bacterium]